ncbi:MAG: DUF2269 domain-containing protein [Alphaproteobacteria bacterium]
MTDGYLVLKWLHIVSATVLFGTGLGTAMHMWLSHRSGDVRAISVAAINTVRADWWFTLPSVIVQPVSGFGLVWLGGYDAGAPWLLATYALYALAGSCWIVVVWLQIRTRDLVAESIRRGQPLPRLYHRMMHIWHILGWPAFLAMLATFWLMVAKPSL